MASFTGYGKTIKHHSGDALVLHHSRDSRVVILEYEVHGKIQSELTVIPRLRSTSNPLLDDDCRHTVLNPG